MTEIAADLIAMAPAPDRLRGEGRKTAISAAADRIATPNVDPRDFDAALLGLFARGRRSSAVTLATLSAIFAAIALTWIEVDAVVTWLCVSLAAQILTQLIARRFPQQDLSHADTRRWRRDFIVTETIQGAIFALLVALVGHAEDPAALACAVVMGLLIAAMNATISPSIPAAAAGGMAPVALAMLSLLWEAHLAEGAAQMIVLGFGAQLCFLMLARKLYASALEALSFQSEKDDLIAELEQSKANSDLARRRAEEANLAKSHFLATMSHELRTPLNAILGFSEVMKGELFGAHIVASYKEYSNDIHASGHHLLMLINEILDLSRIEAGRLELKEEAVALDHIVEDCRHLLALRAKKRGVTINEAVEPDLPRIRADERAVRQMTLNLLSNAVKFTPPGGSVRIRIGWTASGGQYLAMRDSGPGIPAEEIPIVMSSFGRGALARKNAEEGSGLGLPIVKGLVELHEGTFILKSNVGEGLEAIVIFPASRIIPPGAGLDMDLGAARQRRRARREARQVP
ncbi:sensor histidine kinase [Methylocella silvestris]|uniref:histidine kinase n=1 Tax=Methylocella silvestris TaxID=199596 RepID=A0A2J7TK09_METSI|nr:ATP-binding protein [Methylocella silvestris]PNG27110.1 two-component sensor histidine kinase [Methylocella silvestris]